MLIQTIEKAKPKYIMLSSDAIENLEKIPQKLAPQ